MWKGQHQGREVAAKVLKVYKKNDLEQVRRVGPSGAPDMLYATNYISEVLQGGCRMEDLLSSKRTTADGRNNVRESVCDGIRVDGER